MSSTAKRIAAATAAALVIGTAGGLYVASQEPAREATATPPIQQTEAAVEPDDADEPTSREPTEEPTSPEPVDERQQWADAMIDKWTDDRSPYYGNPAQPTDIFRDIESWESPAEGELVIYTDPAINRGSDNCQADLPAPTTNLEMVAADVILALMNNPEVNSVTVKTTDGQCSESITNQEAHDNGWANNEKPR